ncbi:MAG: leucyl/phenylalanyl-tRNA--protein transferase [Desulfobacteraceae bacterium]|nr:MAG: leucyl/phenylalanyl-tRNA--protein transferase [Desulfobacteraceae bacterium]
MTIFLLSDKIAFPPQHLAEKEGLLALGGDLSEKRLLLAYQMGIFPWYSHDEPIMWWSPDPRLVLYPRELKISRSLKKVIHKNTFTIRIDTAFTEVIHACAGIPRKTQDGTWLVEDMITAYCKLHDSGFAHSFEVWKDDHLVGGLYGVSLGKCFFGESMFSSESNASKAALVFLADFLQKRAFHFIDCQVKTDHLLRSGAREIPRKRFLKELADALQFPTLRGKWHPESFLDK